MNLLRLRPDQQCVKNFKHPAFKGVDPVSAQELEKLAHARLSGGPTEPLILGLRSTARYLIGRYLWHYPATGRFIDEMVGEALLAITMLADNLTQDLLNGTCIQALAATRIRGRIEDCLNSLQSVSAPSLRTQSQRSADGLDPIYLESHREPRHEDKPSTDAEEEKTDLLDSLEVLRGDCELAREVLDPDNWGLSDKQLATKLGLSVRHTTRCRLNLLSQFRKLIGEDECDL